MSKKQRKLRKPSLYEGLPVVDAPLGKRLAFTVTKDITKKARSNDPGKCAAAIAASQEYQTEVRVHLTRTYVKAPDKKQWICYLTPESISREIVSFDRGHHFEPGVYEVRAADPGNRLGVNRGKSVHPRSGKQRRGPHHITANVRRSALEAGWDK